MSVVHFDNATSGDTVLLFQLTAYVMHMTFLSLLPWSPFRTAVCLIATMWDQEDMTKMYSECWKHCQRMKLWMYACLRVCFLPDGMNWLCLSTCKRVVKWFRKKTVTERCSLFLLCLYSTYVIFTYLTYLWITSVTHVRAVCKALCNFTVLWNGDNVFKWW
jgi:hypothetical protein